VIVIEAKKYSPKAGKLTAKADKPTGKLDVITLMQVMIER
jgi:hypothetical protein